MIPEVNPPEAPAKALKVESDLPMQNLSNAVMGKFSSEKAAELEVLVEYC